MKRLSILLMISAGAFAQPAPPAPAKKAATAPAKTAAPAKKEEPQPDRPPGLYWILNTSMGTITAQLFEKEAPGTVANFVALTRGTKAAKDKSGAMTKRPYFNNLTFHRVIPNFMIQTGDGQAGDGTGDCGFTIKDEIVPTLKYDKPGVLGLARLNARNTGACQFFITDKEYPSLNGEYTVFGQVVDGQDVVRGVAQERGVVVHSHPLVVGVAPDLQYALVQAELAGQAVVVADGEVDAALGPAHPRVDRPDADERVAFG